MQDSEFRVQNSLNSFTLGGGRVAKRLRGCARQPLLWASEVRVQAETGDHRLSWRLNLDWGLEFGVWGLGIGVQGWGFGTEG